MEIFKRVLKEQHKGEEKQSFKAIQNINVDYTLEKQKKVCIVFSIDVYSPNSSLQLINNDASYMELQQIVKWFINNEYAIDIIDKDCNIRECENLWRKCYDLILGYGKAFDNLKNVNRNAKKILYVTENDYKNTLRYETARVRYYEDRTGKQINLTHSGEDYINDSFKDVDALIILGEPDAFEEYTCKKYYMSPIGLVDPNYSFFEREYDVSKKNFVWLGKKDAIYKGLDILVEAFKEVPYLNLHVIGLNKDEKKLLNVGQAKNIKFYPDLSVGSEKFFEIMNMSSYVIIPSCSEGKCHEILTCMRYGLIPIVSDTMGFNQLAWLVNIIKECSVEHIQKIIEDFASRSADFLENEHRKIFGTSNEVFSIGKYSRDLWEILDEEIVEEIDEEEEFQDE